MSIAAAPRALRHRAPVPLGAAALDGPELAVGVALAAAAVLTQGARPLTLGLVWLAAVTPLLIRVDVREHRLPNAVVLPTAAVAAAAVALDGLLHGVDSALPLVSALVYGGSLLLLHLAGGMGFGDVKLAPVLGLLTAAGSGAAAVLSPALAFLGGGLVAAGVLLRQGPARRIPFGPAMLAGAWLALLLAP